MSFRLSSAITIAALLLFPSPGSPQVLMERNVSVRMAMTIAETALDTCGTRASIAVVDRAGRVRLLLQGDGSSPHSLDLARRKAYTARTFQQTTADWAKRTETDLAGQRLIADVIPLPGGVPIKVGDETIGGVGVSGAQMEEACAKAGIAKVADQLK